MHAYFCSRNLKGRNLLGDLSIDGGIYSNESYGNRVGTCGLDTSGSGHGLVAGSCEHGNEPSGPVQSWEFLD
jgi:hypothetical protein